uniref:Uncharacterized protein n=1 Tax=Ananas comosus var. bracteatus TaxID=296719 RepID=A0A6V7PZZ5_ANACO|nr:unnamed protein product [Ananas comosus var. bracteatus]
MRVWCLVLRLCFPLQFTFPLSLEQLKMSRPHDGQRNFLPFGNPFRSILPNKGSHLSRKLQPLLNNFEEALSLSLKKLKPKDTSDVFTLCWMSQAIECLSEAHTSIEALITELQLPVSDWDEKWIDTYLDSSLKLLDICLALSSELARLDQGQLLLQYVLHVLDRKSTSPTAEQLREDHASLHDYLKKANLRSPKLENCSTILQSLAGSLHLTKVKNSAKGRVLLRALYGVKAVTILICSFFAAAFLGSPQPLMELQVPDEFLWSEAFNELQTAVNEEVRRRFPSGKHTAVKEMEEAESCAKRLHEWTSAFGCEELAEEKINGFIHEREVVKAEKNTEQQEEKENLMECISDTVDSVDKLRHGLDSLSKRVGDFFQIVLSGRDALLCNLRVTNVNKLDRNRS